MVMECKRVIRPVRKMPFASRIENRFSRHPPSSTHLVVLIMSMWSWSICMRKMLTAGKALLQMRQLKVWKGEEARRPASSTHRCIAICGGEEEEGPEMDIASDDLDTSATTTHASPTEYIVLLQIEIWFSFGVDIRTLQIVASNSQSFYHSPL